MARNRHFIITCVLLFVISILYANNTSRLNEQQIVAALIKNYGDRAGKRGVAWFNLLRNNYDLNESTQIKNVNSFFNLLRFTTDIKLWGMSNYWSTPIEFLGANAGDCEDFAIAKYFSLLELGVPDEKMRITMVKSLTLNQYHMVVAYYETPGAIPLILDNIDGIIKPATQRNDLIPVYSFNGKQLWLNKNKGQGVLAGKSERLKRWANLNQRMGISNLKQPTLRME